MPFNTSGLLAFLSNTISFINPPTAPPTPVFERCPETIYLLDILLASVYRLEDQTFLLFRQLGLEKDEQCREITNDLKNFKFSIMRQIITPQDEHPDAQVVIGKRLGWELKTSYVDVAETSGTTIDDLIMRVRDMVNRAGFTYVSRDGVLDLRKITGEEEPLDEEEILRTFGDIVNPSVAEVVTPFSGFAHPTPPRHADGSAAESFLVRETQPVDISGSPDSEHIAFAQRFNRTSTVSSDAGSKVSVMRLDNIQPLSDSPINKPKMPEDGKSLDAAVAAVSLGSTDATPSFSSGEGNYRTIQIFTRRSSVSDVHSTTGNELSQHPAVLTLSQGNFERLIARPATYASGTRPIDLSNAAIVPAAVLPFDARRGEHLPRDYWMQAAPTAIIPFSGQTPDGGSVASGSVTSGATSTDGILYFGPSRPNQINPLPSRDV